MINVSWCLSMAPDVSYIRDSPFAIIGCVLKADQVMEIWHSVKAYMNSKYVLFTIMKIHNCACGD